MKAKVRIGLVALARKTFDYIEAQNIYNQIKQDLSLIENVEWYYDEDLVIEVSDAKGCAERLLKHNLDGIIILSATFHLGHLALEINKVINKPIMLWGLKELPYNGGKIRLNSVCGVNLNASNLYKSGIINYYVHIGDNVNTDWIDAIRIKSTISKSHIGILGHHAHGFYNLGFEDLSAYRELGVLIDHYELSDVYNFDISVDEVNEYVLKLKDIFNISTITNEQLNNVAILIAKFKRFMDINKLDAIAIRCWPEFARDFGIAPCAAMSYLQSLDYIMGCEGDIEGTLSMLAHQAIGATTPFLADLSQVDIEQNYALMWHCGVAPCNLWNKKCEISLDNYFAGGKGITADFVMKSGNLNIMRIDSVNGNYRIFIEAGEGIDMDKLLKGTYVKVIFDHNIQDVLNTVVYNGVAHHVSLVYGDYRQIFRILSRINKWELIEVKSSNN